MSKRVILITGTPCVGKTVTANLLTLKLDAFYINLTDLAINEGLTTGKDEERNSTIIDEEKMQKRINELIRKTGKNDIIIDGHYAVNVVTPSLVTLVFVLRRDPTELRKFMEQRGFSGKKLFENLASEILDVCLVDAVNLVGQRKVCEVNATGKSAGETTSEILSLLENRKDCQVGIVDWLGKLETEGLLDEYLQT